jgi:outer membrane protein
MRYALITTLATLTTSALFSLDARATDLLQVYKEALANDQVYAGARYSLEAGQEKTTQGRAGLLPTVGVGGSYTRNFQDSTAAGVTTDRNSTTNSYRVELTQPLFRWANWEQYQQGKLAAAASEAQFAQAQQDLILRVSQAYFDLLAALDTLASLQAQKAATSEQLASAKRNFEVGTATITDTHEAQARSDLITAQEFAAANDVEIKRAALQQIIGKPPGELAILRPGVQLTPPQPADPEKWIVNAETQNYGVVGKQLALEIAQRDIKKNRAGHLPTLDFVASRSHSNQAGNSLTTAGNVSNGNAVGLNWNMPLFAGFAVTSKTNESIALAEFARTDFENTRRTAAQVARTAYSGVNSGLSQVKALEAAEVSSLSSLESNRLGYQVGVRINIDVLNAQQQLFATRRDLAKARYDTLVNGLKLKSAAGSLKEDDLVEVNKLLVEPSKVVPATPAPPVKPVSAAPAPATVLAAVDKSKPIKTDLPRTSGESDQVLGTVNQWAQAWSARDTKTYFGFYSPDFKTADGRSRKTWEAQRRARIASKKNIAVKIEAPEVTIDGNTATVKFRQVYASGRVSATDNKVLRLVKQGDAWQITLEASAG